MGREKSGHSRRLSLPRRWITDLMHVSRNVPLIPMERRMQLQSVAAARAELTPRPSWSVLFTKAYGRVALRRPELRRAFLTIPWQRLYEHPQSIASIAIEREYEGEPAIFFALIHGPESKTIAELDAKLRRFQTEPLRNFGIYRRLLRVSRFPLPIRRTVWWYILNVWGLDRARHLGTFGLSVTAKEGASALRLIAPLSTCLNYGRFHPDGSLDVRLHFDHRVLDGVPAAKALCDLEETLCTEIVDELRSMRK
jgi:hypothetical protein